GWPIGPFHALDARVGGEPQRAVGVYGRRADGVAAHGLARPGKAPPGVAVEDAIAVARRGVVDAAGGIERKMGERAGRHTLRAVEGRDTAGFDGVEAAHG